MSFINVNNFKVFVVFTYSALYSAIKLLCSVSAEIKKILKGLV